MLRILGFLLRYLRQTWNGVLGPLRLLFQHSELLFLLVKRDVALRTAGTWIGAVWIVAQPALQVIAFWFLLDLVLRVKLPGSVPFVDYFLIGMLLWLLIAEVLNRALTIMGEFASLYQRSQFPVLLLPLLPLIVSGIVYGAVYAVMLAFMYGAGTALMGLALVAAVVVWLVPFVYLLSLVGVFVKDLAQLFPFAITLVMYLTPIMYKREMLPEAMQRLLVINPFADWMVVAHGLLQAEPWDPVSVVRLMLVWLVLAGPAWVLFHRMQPHFREAL